MTRTKRAACLVFLMGCSGARSDELGESLDAATQGQAEGGDDGVSVSDGDAGGLDAEDAGEVDGGALEPDSGTNPSAVRGQLLSSAGEPLADVRLRVGGQTVQTDAAGLFTADVAAPYDIVVMQDTSTYVFLDVERLDPTLHLPTYASARRAQVAGRVVGGELVTFPLDTTTYVDITFAGAPGFFSERLNPGDGASYGPFPVDWSVGDTVSGYLVAVASSYTGTGFSEPVAVAVSPLQLSDGVDVTGSPATLLTLVEPATRTVQVDIGLPEDYQVDSCQKSLGTYRRWLDDPGAAFPMTVVDGLPADLEQSFYCELRDSAGRLLQVFRAIGDETTLAFDPPAGVRALAPVEGATLTADDAFTFTPQADAVSFVNITWTRVEAEGEVTTDYTVQVATDADRVPLARLAALGVDISPASEWSVSAQGSWESLDAYLGPDPVPAGERVSSADLQRRLGIAP
jgi:hypothetical protein